MLARAAMTSGPGWTLPGAGTPLGVTVVPIVATALSIRGLSGPVATKAHGMTGQLTALLPVRCGFVYQLCKNLVLEADVNDQCANGCHCRCCSKAWCS